MEKGDMSNHVVLSRLDKAIARKFIDNLPLSNFHNAYKGEYRIRPALLFQ